MAITGEDGSYEISFMTPSHKMLNLRVFVENLGANEFSAYQGENVQVGAVFVAASKSVKVKVVDEKGAPVAGAVARNIQTYTTGKDGYFTDTMLPTHRFTWDVAAPGFELKRFAYWIGDGIPDPVIQLIPCKPATGKVVDADGKPVPHLTLCGGSQWGLHALPNWTMQTDEKGEFSMGTMNEGSVPTPVIPLRGESVIGPPVIVSCPDRPGWC